MTEQRVDIVVLQNATVLWREQSQAATSAASTIADAPVSGFDPAVRDAVSSFLATWSDITKQIADRAEETAEGLHEGWKGYVMMDMEAQQEFELKYGYLS